MSAVLITLHVLMTPFLQSAGDQLLTTRMHHLRADGPREWSEFPEASEGPSLRLKFRTTANKTERSLRLRQRDVKETWRVALNGKQIGRLIQDENLMTIRLPIPAGSLVDGDNTLVIEQTNRVADDVMVGDVAIDDRSVTAKLNEATIEVEVVDAVTGSPVPCRLTILDAAGSLATVGAASGSGLTVRPGVVYSATGTSKFGLPAGDYTLHAGRGFEYSVDSIRLNVRAGDVVRKKLSIRREVALEGYISCDPHIHTLTGSGHGDATLDERMATLAGEGIDLPIATEHNRQDNWRPAAVRQGVGKSFTPIVGNEVTTDLGHFNVFPLPAGGPIPDHRAKDWSKLFDGIDAASGGKGVVILNHARDRHKGFAPFGNEHHVSIAGENLDGWKLRANAMEVVNSGAQRNEVMDLPRDWMGMLNAGAFLTPVGASDSHDVARYIVGQGRTYIRHNGKRAGEIDAAAAVVSFRDGEVLASCGLVASIKVNGRYGPGDLVPQTDEVSVDIRVLGPSWTKADRVELYSNGMKVREAKIEGRKHGGEIWSGEWKLPPPRHDVYLAVIATGPGIRELYWPIAKPYQPTSTVVDPRVIAVTGAVWIDADGDGRRSSAADYARRLKERFGSDYSKMIAALADHDEAVAVQAAAQLRRGGTSPFDPAIRSAAVKAGAQVERGFQAYADAWKESQLAKSRLESGLPR
jgi:hypothetical protein